MGRLHGPRSEGALAREPPRAVLDGRRRGSGGHHHLLQPRRPHDPRLLPHNVAKAGLGGLVQSLAVEWGPDVRAVGIAPGFIDTPINEEWFSTFDDPATERRKTEARHSVGKIGDSEEIAGLCAFLASDYGSFISGTTILADGGRAALMQDGPRYVDDGDVRS